MKRKPIMITVGVKGESLSLHLDEEGYAGKELQKIRENFWHVAKSIGEITSDSVFRARAFEVVHAFADELARRCRRKRRLGPDDRERIVPILEQALLGRLAEKWQADERTGAKLRAIVFRYEKASGSLRRYAPEGVARAHREAELRLLESIDHVYSTRGSKPHRGRGRPARPWRSCAVRDLHILGVSRDLAEQLMAAVGDDPSRT